jgi:5-hydroxyisourate hydrolase
VSTVTTHVLDVGFGRPAEGVSVTLTREGALVASGLTDADGRVRGLGTEPGPLGAGSYRLTFAVRDYFAKTGRDAFYREVVVQFEIGGGEEDYHVPLLLGPFGYTTYRGR